MSGCERSEKTGLRMLGQIPRRPRTVRTTGVRWCLEFSANSDPEALTRLPRKARQALPVTTNLTSVIWEWERELARLAGSTFTQMGASRTMMTTVSGWSPRAILR